MYIQSTPNNNPFPLRPLALRALRVPNENITSLHLPDANTSNIYLNLNIDRIVAISK